MINSIEPLFVVDEFDVPQEPRPRHETLKNGLWHRTTHVWIKNKKKQLLCQKRSMLKDISPGKWEACIAGHIGPGDNYFSGAVKEVREETGIPVTKEDLNLVKIYKDEKTREFRGIFYLSWEGDLASITSEKEEVDAVKWVNIETLKSYLLYQRLNSWILPGYEKEILSVFTKN